MLANPEPIRAAVQRQVLSYAAGHWSTVMEGSARLNESSLTVGLLPRTSVPHYTSPYAL